MGGFGRWVWASLEEFHMPGRIRAMLTVAALQAARQSQKGRLFGKIVLASNYLIDPFSP